MNQTTCTCPIDCRCRRETNPPCGCREHRSLTHPETTCARCGTEIHLDDEDRDNASGFTIYRDLDGDAFCLAGTGAHLHHPAGLNPLRPLDQPYTPQGVCWEQQAGCDPIRLSRTIKVF